MHIRSLAIALLLSTTAASAASVSDFSLVDNGDGSVTLSWTVSGSSGMFYRGYNVAVSRGTSPNQAASTRTLVEGDSGGYMTQQGTTGNVRDAPPATGETYYYWLHYSNYSIINDTENFFFNYLGGSPGTILSAPCTGPRSYQSSGGEDTNADQRFMMVSSVSLSKKCRRVVSRATFTSSPARVLVRGSTRAITFSSLPEVEKYR